MYRCFLCHQIGEIWDFSICPWHLVFGIAIFIISIFDIVIFGIIFLILFLRGHVFDGMASGPWLQGDGFDGMA